MHDLRIVFVEGLRYALRLRLLLPLYLSGLLLGLVQTWPLLYAAADGALNNPLLGELARGGSDALVNLMLARPQEVGVALTGWLVITLLFTLLFSIVYNFFSGGILSSWAGTRPFWAGCWHTFLSFCGLGGVLVLLAVVSLLIGALLWGAVGGTVVLVLVLLLLQVINLLGEYARALAVVHNRRNPFVLFGMAVGFCVRHTGGVLLLAVLGLLFHGVVLLVARLLLNVGGGAVIGIVVQQLVVLIWLWVKLLRLAWAVSYARVASGEWGVASGAWRVGQS